MTKAKYIGTGGHKQKTNHFEAVDILNGDIYLFVAPPYCYEDEITIKLNDRFFGEVQLDNLMELLTEDEIDELCSKGQIYKKMFYSDLSKLSTFNLTGEE